MRKVIWGKSSGCLSRGVTRTERCVIVICGWIRKLRNTLKGNCGKRLKYRMGRHNAEWTELAEITDCTCVNSETLRTVRCEECNITECTVWRVQHYGLYCVNSTTLRTVLCEQCNITDCTLNRITLRTALCQQCNITDCTVSTVQHYGLYCVNSATLRTVLCEQCNQFLGLKTKP